MNFIKRYYGQKRYREGGPGSGNWGHKGIPGQRGGSAPRGGGGAFGGAQASLDDITVAGLGRQKSREAQEMIYSVVSEFEIPKQHIENIKFTTNPLPGYRNGADGFIQSSQGYKVNGVSRSLGRGRSVISVHESRLESSTVVHEIGHSVERALGLSDSSDFQAAYHELLGKPPSELSDRGLRQYSMKNYKEFVADTYVTAAHGPKGEFFKTQADKLAKDFRPDWDSSDLAKVFTE